MNEQWKAQATIPTARVHRATSAIVQSISDREVDDVQSIEQPLTEFAGSEAIEKRHGGGRDEANFGRRSSCGFKFLKHVQQALLNQGRQLLNVADEERPARCRVEGKAARVPQHIGRGR